MYFKKLGTGRNFCNFNGSNHVNKLHLFILKQHRFIIVQIATFTRVLPLHVCYIFGLYLGHPQECQYKNLTKECTKKSKGAPCLQPLFFFKFNLMFISFFVRHLY